MHLQKKYASSIIMTVISFIWIFVLLVPGNPLTGLGKGSNAEMRSEVGPDIFLPHRYYLKLLKLRGQKVDTGLRAAEVGFLNVDGSVEVADVIPDGRKGISVSSQGVVEKNGTSIRKHNVTMLEHEQIQETYYPLEFDEWGPTKRDDLKTAGSNNGNTSQANKQGRKSHNHKGIVEGFRRTKRSTTGKLISPTSLNTPIRSYRKIQRSKSERRARSNGEGYIKAIHKRGAKRLSRNVNNNSKTRRPAKRSASRFRSRNNFSRRRSIKKLNKEKVGVKRSGTNGVRGRRGDLKIRSSRPRDTKSASRANTSQKVVQTKPQKLKLYARRLKGITQRGMESHKVKQQLPRSVDSEKRADSATHRKSVKNANVNLRSDNANSTKQTSIRRKRKPGGNRKKNSIISNNSNAQVKSNDQEDKVDHRKFGNSKKSKLKSEDTKSVQKAKPLLEKKNAKEIKKHNNTRDDGSGKSEERPSKASNKDVPLRRKPDEKKLNNTATGKGSNSASGKEAPLQNKTNGKILNTNRIDNSSNNESEKEAQLKGKPNGKNLNNIAISNNTDNALGKKGSLPRKPGEIKLDNTAIDKSNSSATKEVASLQGKTIANKLNKKTIDNTGNSKSIEATKTQNKTKSGDRNLQKLTIDDTNSQDKIDSGDHTTSREDVVNNTPVAKNKTKKQEHAQEYSADTSKSNSSHTSDPKADKGNSITERNKHKIKPRPGARRSGFAGVYDARNSIITKKFRDLKKSNSTKPISTRQDVKTQNKQKHNNSADSNVLKPKTADRRKGDVENHGSVKLAAKRLETEAAHRNNIVTKKSRSRKIHKADRQESGEDSALDFRTGNRNSIKRKGRKTMRKHKPYDNNALNFRTNGYNSVSKRRARNKSGRKTDTKSINRADARIENKGITKGQHEVSKESLTDLGTPNSNPLKSKNIKNRNIQNQRVRTVKQENVKNKGARNKEPKSQVSLEDTISGKHKSVNLKHSDKSAHEMNFKYGSSLRKSDAMIEHQHPFQNKTVKSVKNHRPHSEIDNSNLVSRRIHEKDHKPIKHKNPGKLVVHRLSSTTHRGDRFKGPSQRSQNINAVNKNIKSGGQYTKPRRDGRAKTTSKLKRAKAKKEKNQNEAMFRFFADKVEDEDDWASERVFPTVNKKEERESGNMQISNNGLDLYSEPPPYKVEHMNRGNLFEPNNLEDSQYSNKIIEHNHGNDLPCLLQKLDSFSGGKNQQKCDESNLPNRQNLNISHVVRLKTSIPFPNVPKKSFMKKASGMEHEEPTIINFQNGTEYNVSNITKTSHSLGSEGQQKVDESIVKTVSKSYSMLQIASVDPISKEYLQLILG